MGNIDFVGANSVRPPKIILSDYGHCVDIAIQAIPYHYPGITVEKYVIMPNHIHLLLIVENDGRTMFAPTISQVIKQMKGYVTKKVGKPVWQKSFYDHIVRNKNDYSEIWQYIDNNPYKWKEDQLYNETV